MRAGAPATTTETTAKRRQPRIGRGSGRKKPSATSKHGGGGDGRSAGEHGGGDDGGDSKIGGDNDDFVGGRAASITATATVSAAAGPAIRGGGSFGNNTLSAQWPRQHHHQLQRHAFQLQLQRPVCFSATTQRCAAATAACASAAQCQRQRQHHPRCIINIGGSIATSVTGDKQHQCRIIQQCNYASALAGAAATRATSNFSVSTSDQRER